VDVGDSDITQAYSTAVLIINVKGFIV
jgi:hypothetical protein